jgi:hypothetical protein
MRPVSNRIESGSKADLIVQSLFAHRRLVARRQRLKNKRKSLAAQLHSAIVCSAAASAQKAALSASPFNLSDFSNGKHAGRR